MLNRDLGKLTSSAIGLGCMPMSWGYGVENVDPVEVRATLREAIDLGDRKSTRLNSSHSQQSRMPSSA